MPTFNFKIKKDVVNVIDKKPDKNIGTIDTNNVRLYFEVINSKKVDREKTYYSAFFKDIIKKKSDIIIIFVFMKKKLMMLLNLKEIILVLIVFIWDILFLIVIRILMLMCIL